MTSDQLRSIKDLLLTPSGGGVAPEKSIASRIYAKALSNGQGQGRFPLHFGIDPWAINSQVLMLQVGGQQIHTTYGELLGIIGAAMVDVLIEELDGKAPKAAGL